MYKIGDFAKKFHLSRSAILYYDQLGLLKPMERAPNHYRVYGQNEMDKLDKIVNYRASGLSLRDIQKLLVAENDDKTGILVERLNQIQREIKDLKNQEKLVLDVLKEEVTLGKSIFSSSKAWTEMLVRLGYEEADWLNWHREFERDHPAGHAQFLRNLNMEEAEIESLLDRLRKMADVNCEITI